MKFTNGMWLPRNSVSLSSQFKERILTNKKARKISNHLQMDSENDVIESLRQVRRIIYEFISNNNNCRGASNGNN